VGVAAANAISILILSGKNLSQQNFKKVCIPGACLRGAHLDGVNLRGADLTGVDLSKASLKGAVLDGANMSGVHFANDIACLPPPAEAPGIIRQINILAATLRTNHQMNWLIVGCPDGSIFHVDKATNPCLRDLMGTTSDLRFLILLRDGTMLASGGWNN